MQIVCWLHCHANKIVFLSYLHWVKYRLIIIKIDLFSDPDAPPRPPLPAEVGRGYGSNMGSGIGARSGHPDTTDDESEEIFQKAPTPSQGPIMVSWPPAVT